MYIHTYMHAYIHSNVQPFFILCKRRLNPYMLRLEHPGICFVNNKRKMHLYIAYMTIESFEVLYVCLLILYKF